MVLLVIPLPAGTAAKIRSCVVLLSPDDKPAQVSTLLQIGNSGDAYIKAKKAYFVLRQEMTYCRVLRVQLQCYPEPFPPNLEHFISRTELSERIMFSPALADGLEDLPEAQQNPGAVSEIIGYLAWLRRTGLSGNLPVWDGDAWPGSGTTGDIEFVALSVEEALAILNQSNEEET